ncbi:MAG: hypothetical protein ABH856_04465 [Patescibacteria group bacterium]|nr:hypothetical protein [Patescibacteria group bacterium]
MPLPDDNHTFHDKTFDGDDILFHEKPINPKNYPTFEEYLEALRVREEFHERVKEVDRIIKESKTDKEYRRRMGELGFSECKRD